MKKPKSGNRGSGAKGNSASKNVDEYLAGVPEPACSTLNKMRAVIQSALPSDATDTISYKLLRSSAFLGSQGDVWDAQKDMLLAGCGAMLAMLSVAAFNFYYDRNFVRDLQQGFRLDKNDQPLGEISLRKLATWH